MKSMTPQGITGLERVNCLFIGTILVVLFIPGQEKDSGHMCVKSEM
jgi:hypothetical protein